MHTPLETNLARQRTAREVARAVRPLGVPIDTHLHADATSCSDAV